jgi:hypothetical protein
MSPIEKASHTLDAQNGAGRGELCSDTAAAVAASSSAGLPQLATPASISPRAIARLPG